MAQTRESLKEQDLAQARKEVERLRAEIADRERQITEASRIIRGWEAFDLAMQGKITLPGDETPAEPKTRKATGTRARAGAPSEIQKQIAAVIDRYPDGAKSQVMYADLRDSYETKQIDAALLRMKKSGDLIQARRKQPYTLTAKGRELLQPTPATPSQETPAETTSREEAAA
jgi:uncharacterized protein YjhX (UPF0386 family)